MDARLCHWLPDLRPGLRGGGRSEGADQAGAEATRPPPRSRACRRAGLTARLLRERGRGSRPRRSRSLPATRAPAPPYPSSRRFLRGLPSAWAVASHPAAGPNPSGVEAVAALAGRRGGAGRRKRGRRVPAASKRLRCAPPGVDPEGGAPDVAGPGLLPGRGGGGPRGARARGRGGCSETAFIGSLEIRVSNNCTEAPTRARLPHSRPARKSSFVWGAGRRLWPSQ